MPDTNQELQPGAKYAKLFAKDGTEVTPSEPIPLIPLSVTRGWPTQVTQDNVTYSYDPSLTTTHSVPCYRRLS